ncbi:ribonuclease H family protein [Enterococcus sp. N249-2]
MEREDLFKLIKEISLNVDGLSGIVQNEMLITREMYSDLNNRVSEIVSKIKNWESEIEKMVSDKQEVVIVYSDGGCRVKNNIKGNKVGENDVCAYAYRIELDGQVVENGKAFKGMTNNRMELRGFGSALAWLVKNGQANQKIICYLDSKYVLDGVQKWLAGWKKNGWKNSSKQTIANVEEWKGIDSLLINFLDIEYVWVKGHADTEGNIAVDRLLNDKMNELEREHNERKNII